MSGTREVEINGQNLFQALRTLTETSSTEMQYNRVRDLIKSQNPFGSQDTKERITSASMGQQRLQGRGLSIPSSLKATLGQGQYLGPVPQRGLAQ